MITSKATEPQIAIILTWQWIPINACNRWGRDRIASGGTSTWARRAVSVVAAEVAKTNVISWASAGNTNWAWASGWG